MMSAPSRLTKKQRTRMRIIENAIALFRERGIRSARLAEIAARSDVSSATLFNYFPTKGVLAEAWVRGEIASTLARAIEDAVARDRSLRSAIRVAVREIAEAAAEEPMLRLEAWQEAGRSVSAPINAAADAEDSKAASQPHGALVGALLREQEREHVRADLSAASLAEMVVDGIEGGLIAGLRQVARETGRDRAEASVARAGPIGASVRSRVDLVLDGARKRNERVRPPARSR